MLMKLQSSFVVQDQHSFHFVSWRHHRQLSWKLSSLGPLEAWGSSLLLGGCRVWDPPSMILRLYPVLWLTPGWRGSQSGIPAELTFLNSFSLKILGKPAARIKWKVKKIRNQCMHTCMHTPSCLTLWDHMDCISHQALLWNFPGMNIGTV